MEYNPTKEKVKELYDIHIVRYGKRLEQANLGESGYKRDELVYLVSIWKEVKAKDYDFNKLTSDAKTEVIEALMDEDCSNCEEDCEYKDDTDEEFDE